MAKKANGNQKKNSKKAGRHLDDCKAYRLRKDPHSGNRKKTTKSKEKRGCGPIGRKLKAENGLKGQRISVSYNPKRDMAAAFKEEKKAKATEVDAVVAEKSIKGSSKLYHELLAQWS